MFIISKKYSKNSLLSSYMNIISNKFAKRLKVTFELVPQRHYIHLKQEELKENYT